LSRQVPPTLPARARTTKSVTTLAPQPHGGSQPAEPGSDRCHPPYMLDVLVLVLDLVLDLVLVPVLVLVLGHTGSLHA
jgi:hypothetical protein